MGRGPVRLLPPSLHDLVPAGHPAHRVRELVRAELDLTAILAPYERKERGQPPDHPAMMVALLLYAYTQGLYSSRRIAKACEERLDVMAMTGMQRPHFRTISDFRKRHLEAPTVLFMEVLRLCRAAGLVKLGHVALDGTKIKANASKHKAMSYRRMQRAEAERAPRSRAARDPGRRDRARLGRPRLSPRSTPRHAAAISWAMAKAISSATRMTVDQFLAWLEDGPQGARYELVAGQVVAMAPERAAHARVKAEVWLALRDGIRSAGLACEALPDGMTVKIDEHTAYEPDALVHCDQPLADDALIVPAPVIVVEVLSPTTKAHDAGAKLVTISACRVCATTSWCGPSG